MLVAAAEVLAARDEGRDDLHARLARACLDASGVAGTRLLRGVDSGFGRVLLRLAEAAILPGIAAHYRWRKRRIRRWLHDEIAAGARQLLVIGAGFDALGPCMAARYPVLRVFEVDRPGTIAIRQHALSACGFGQPGLALRGADLADASLADVLDGFRDPGFDRDAPTVAVAEGVLMYLPPDAVAGLWRGLRAHCAARVGVIASAMACDGSGVPGFRRQCRWLHRWLARRGEAFAWGVTAARLPAVMAAAGLAVAQVADADDPCDPDPCQGEWLFRGVLSSR